MDKKLKVAGKVIEELSEKIPSPIIAFNELIKNSYDAGAPMVSVELNTNNRKLIISDNGEGMDEGDINVLLQIAKSTKKYGQINPKTGRYIQGSKGLGFLSVFKFGDVVKWTTTKDKKRSFSINYQDVLKLEDITEYIVSISEEDTTDMDIGTKIEIELRNDYNTIYLKEYLLNQMNRDKILNSFIDSKFIIKLEIDGDKYQTKENLSLEPYYQEYQFFKVTYSSISQNINIIYKQHYRYGSSTTADRTISFDPCLNNRYTLSLELMIFDFYRARRRNDPDKLFIINETKITPLIFINKNLFNNFSLFDPELLRYSQSGISLPQMIGYVEIISDDKDIQFNSDRTQFQENELTASIRKVLEDLNKQIQKSCSEIKDELKNRNNNEEAQTEGANDEDKSSNSENDSSEETSAESEKDNSQDTSTKNDNDSNSDANNNQGCNGTTSERLRPVVLEVVEEETLTTPTGQIDLKNYIVRAVDSLGRAITFEDIQITIDGVNVVQGVMASIIDACQKVVMYTYIDPRTGRHDSCMRLNMENDSLQASDSRRVLIPNKAINSYSVTFRNNPITDLLPQIESLYSKYKTSYSEVIACSLRALFELSIYELEMAGLVNFIKAPGYRDDKLTGKVANLIISILGDASLINCILAGLGRSGDYQQFTNELRTIDFKTIVKKCHLGAHRSTGSLFDSDIKSIGNAAGLFLVIVNELLNNHNINWSSLGQPWQITII